jgi:hypothetical protein
MSDYAQITDFSAKDALITGDPEKLILGSDVDDELAAISVAIATKYDSNDLASQAQAEAETSNVVLMTPLRVANWADANGGIVGDLQALTDPGADRVFGWDESANAAIGFSLSTGLTSSGTTLLIDTAVVPQLAASNSFTGENTISAATPKLIFYETDQGSDGKGWSLRASGGLFRLATRTDAGTDTTNVISVTRSGTDATEVDISATTLDFNATTLELAGDLSTPNTSASEVGYKGTPVIDATVADTATSASNTGKLIRTTFNGGDLDIIDANHQVGDVLVIFNNAANNTSSITITNTGTQYLAGTAFATSGTRTLAVGGLATFVKVLAGNWMCSGSGLT